MRDQVPHPYKTEDKISVEGLKRGLLADGFLLGSFFDPEDGSDIFLLNVRSIYIPEDNTLHKQGCEILKF
jgi:hypothetical protein